MISFFDTEEKKARLYVLAHAWRGTPFVPHAKLRGAGVDCVHLCAEIYKECGALTVFNPPNYSMDGGKHLKTSKVIQWIEASGRFVKVEKLEVGDLLCFKIGEVEHHVGLHVFGAAFVHAFKGYGVTFGNVGDATWQKRLAAIYRPLPLAP